MTIKFCNLCGTEVILVIPEGDNRRRHVCPGCDTIHYLNPKNVAGCLPILEDKVLLCRRAIEPRYGLWTLPAGFMENDETTLEAAVRETWEEALAKVSIDGLHTLLNLPHVNQIYLMYRAQLLNTDFGPGTESLEVKLFSEEEIPWDELAFATIYHTLKFYFEDRRRGDYPLHTGDIVIANGKYHGFKTQR